MALIEAQVGTETLMKVVVGKQVEKELLFGCRSLVVAVTIAMALAVDEVVVGPLLGALAFFYV